jgi:hypothetical protein
VNAHTVGPWSLNRGAQADAYAVESSTRTIAHVKYSRSEGETIANARLIAAAPELLDFVEKILPSLELAAHDHALELLAKVRG